MWRFLKFSCCAVVAVSMLNCGKQTTDTKKQPVKDEKAKKVTKPVSQEIAGAQADKFLQIIKNGKYAEASNLMTDKMISGFGPDKMKATWDGIQAKFGSCEGFGKTRFEVKGPSHVVRVMAKFEDIPMDLIVSIDPEKKVEGFFIRQVEMDRAQTPKPPFPYNQREVLYDNPADKSKLAGTLTIPKGKGPFPGVLLITGSGAQDRDETIFGHKPFFVIADHLTRNGIAVLRVDDRGVGKTTGDPRKATIETHATDVEAGVAFLKKQKEINPKKIGLIGHSEGGVIAPMVASKSPDVAFVISLAGTGITGAELNPMQIEAILKADGKFPADQIPKLVGYQKKIMDLFVKGAKTEEIKAVVKEATELALKHVPAKKKEVFTKEMLEKRLTMQMAMLESPWFLSFAKLDPATYWTKVKCPVLVLIGEKDTQVPAEANIKPVVAALKKAGNKDVTTKKLPKLNHMFQTAKKGTLIEYAELDETFHKPTLELMTKWLKERMVK